MTDTVNEGGQRGVASDLTVRQVLNAVALQTFVFTLIGYALWEMAERKAGPFISAGLWEFGLGAGLAGALIALSASLAALFPSLAERLVRAQARQYPFLRHGLSWPAIVFISICAGVGEEALFRGGVQTWLADYMPMPLALGLAAGFFAVIHFARPLNSALIFVIGTVFGLVYWHTGSLTAVVVGHAVYDVYALAALQRALQRIGVFTSDAAQDLPPAPARETLHETEQCEDKQS